MTQAILTVSTLFQDAIIGFADIIKDMKRASARRAMTRKTHRELSQLTNLELKDIGISRSDITSIANGNFHDRSNTKLEPNKNLKGWV